MRILFISTIMFLFTGLFEKSNPVFKLVSIGTVQETEGIIVVETGGYGSNKNDATLDAEQKAFETILFRGMPGTDLSEPLVANEKDAKAKYAAYFKKLFAAERMNSFVSGTEVTSAFVKKTKGSKNITVQTSINYKALRRDLEQNNVIRKFGL